MLIDGGGTRDGQFDTGARIVEPFLRARGISRLDVVALSHPHPDHLNGLFRILQRFPVGAFWSSGDDGHNPEYRRLVALAAARGVPTPEIAPTALGGARVEPLGPFLDGRIAAPPGLTVNDASLVLRVAFAGRVGALPGRSRGRRRRASSLGRRALGQTVAAGRAQGSAPRQPDVVERRAARRGRARAGGDVARLAQPVPFSGARGSRPLRGARGADVCGPIATARSR